jgi:tetratricopeptide (TPR) repeat protein
MLAPGSRPRSARALGLGVAAMLTFAACDALTATPPGGPGSAEQQALDVYKKSKAAYDRGDFKTAVDLLLQAYAIEPKPVILFNLARAYEGLGEVENAIDAYTRYLEKEPNSSDRGALERRVATLEKQREERAALEKERDERAKLELEQTERGASGGVTPKGRLSLVPWIVGGVGLLSIGTGVGLGVAVGPLHQSAVGDKDAGTALSKQAQAQSVATAANVLFIVGGSLALGGATWGVIELATRSGRGAKVAVGPGSVTVAGSF